MLDRVVTETLDQTYGDNLDIVRLGHVAHVGNMMTGKIIRTSTGYTLQINVTDTTPNAETLASYSGSFTAAQLDNHTAIQIASRELLAQMGVRLTDKAIAELGTTSSQQTIAGETALARGVTAQRQGTEVAALSYFFQAAAFEPALAEAVSRSSIITANISSGNIGADARNEIQWRRQWMERLAETEQFFNNYFTNFFKNTPPLPFTLYYTSNIKQIGEINFQNETVTLGGMIAELTASLEWVKAVEPVFLPMQRSVQAVLDGLNATGRSSTWGLGNWPASGSFNLQPFGKQTGKFSAVAELVNSNNRVIGRQTIQTEAVFEFPIPLPGRGEQNIRVNSGGTRSVNFSNVKVDDITDNLTIRIATVNGTPAETAAQNGVLQIQAMPVPEFLSAFCLHQMVRVPGGSFDLGRNLGTAGGGDETPV